MSKISGELPTAVPLPDNEKDLKVLVNKCKDWAIMHGISMRSKVNFSEDIVQIAPFILTPTSIPSREFNKVVELQTILQELLHKIANDREFIKACYRDIIEADEFSGRLYKIYEQVEEEGVAQKIAMMHLRSDYLMQNTMNNNFKQVEFNTISASFASLSTFMTDLNKYVLGELGCTDKLKNIPNNRSLVGLAQGLIDAWRLYKDQNACIMFIVENPVHNISDQRLIEFEIKKLNPTIRVIRRTFLEIHTNGSLKDNRELVIDNCVIAVAYFRDGYAPSNFPTDKEWDARLLIERSVAIKCPDIKFHLIGQKKVQQELTKSGVLERFLTETKKIKAVREVFMNIYGLEFDEHGDRAVQMALDNPENFVLKPQREGGGYNIYGSDIKDLMLKINNSKERLSYILMERIFPPVSKGYMILPGSQPVLTELISEIGIYGILISDGQKIVVNEQAGHMIRSKVSTSNEGGVIAGAAALDCPYLFD
ncbi:unnamed protein product [Phyllotreta striolata]|uniref:Glutathione synthetase n=1 Tax=Phyllotreta striolata TaxID=444603 RepID=A0A9N9XPX6_PHYSR|nr:unnamed protein product [Phyllotreta striolata]